LGRRFDRDGSIGEQRSKTFDAIGRDERLGCVRATARGSKDYR
jgi:hypothetical protein